MSQLKPIEQWDEEYVATLPVEELDWIDYKASAKFNNFDRVELSRYLSAWANYGGGYLIFGITDPSAGMPLAIDGGVIEAVRPNLPTWIDQTLSSLTEPTLPHFASWLIRPKPVGSRIKPGHALIVWHIPESPAAPHQALDHKYYQRAGRLLLPLKHRAVMDILNRRKYPKISVRIVIYTPKNGRWSLVWELKNVGPVIAMNYKIVIECPFLLYGEKVYIDPAGKPRRKETIAGETFFEVRAAKLVNWSPLFPGSDVSGSFEIAIGANLHPSPVKSTKDIVVTVFADEMPPMKETFLATKVRNSD